VEFWLDHAALTEDLAAPAPQDPRRFREVVGFWASAGNKSTETTVILV
jgi:hypothetical protein